MIVYESKQVVITDISISHCRRHKAQLKDDRGFCVGHPVCVCGTAQEAFNNLRDCYRGYVNIKTEVIN